MAEGQSSFLLDEELKNEVAGSDENSKDDPEESCIRPPEGLSVESERGED